LGNGQPANPNGPRAAVRRAGHDRTCSLRHRRNHPFSGRSPRVLLPSAKIGMSSCAAIAAILSRMSSSHLADAGASPASESFSVAAPGRLPIGRSGPEGTGNLPHVLSTPVVRRCAGHAASVPRIEPPDGGLTHSALPPDCPTKDCRTSKASGKGSRDSVECRATRLGFRHAHRRHREEPAETRERRRHRGRRSGSERHPRGALAT
jgi:hypothetical protein